MSAGILSIFVTAVSAWPSGLTDNAAAHRSSSSEEFRAAGQWGCWAGDHIAPGSQSVARHGGREASFVPSLISCRTFSYFPGTGASPLWHSSTCPGIERWGHQVRDGISSQSWNYLQAKPTLLQTSIPTPRDDASYS